MAAATLEKALIFSLDHVPAVVHMARMHIQEGGASISLAEGYLDVLTQTSGWDLSEAWFLLAQVYKATDRKERAQESLEYALELELSRGVREVCFAVPRVL